MMTMLLLLAGNSCEIVDEMTDTDVESLEGEWLCNEQSEQYKASLLTYTVRIYADDDRYSGIILENFYQLGDVAVRATVTGAVITIGSQVVEGGFTIGGTGTISSGNSRIIWSYTVDDGSHVIDHVTAVYTKL